MIQQQLLNNIYEAAKEKDYREVRYILNLKIFSPRTAQLYCEEMKNDYEAGKFIYKQAICKCGNIITDWDWRNPKYPICANCNFHKYINNKIDF